MGQVWTDEQCAQQLADDVLKHSKFLSCITYRPLSDGNKAAFASFEFNVGSEAFCNSTLARKANAGRLGGRLRGTEPLDARRRCGVARVGQAPGTGAKGVNHEPIRISPRHLHRPRVRRQDHHQPGADRLHHAAGVEPDSGHRRVVAHGHDRWRCVGIASAASSPTVKDR